MTERPTDGFIISREEFAELTRLYAARINSKNVGRIPAIFNSVRSHPYQSERERLHFSSSDLLLMAHDEWKRREERKHIHEHISWVNGWISGFLTSRKFVQEKVAELRQEGKEGE